MEIKNFTLSKDWVLALPIRYSVNSVSKISGLSFWNNNDVLACQHYFDFSISDTDFEEMKKFLDQDKMFKFSYINSSSFQKIREWCERENLSFDVIDHWLAPQLILKEMSVSEYIESSTNGQTKRNFAGYLKNKDDYSFVCSDIENVLMLWNDVLKTDADSWKGQQKCDMKSLNREDLQYIFYLINNPDNTTLNVTYKDGLPLAYSLMFRADPNSMWYAVKWGASDQGRKEKAGFYCLYNHLEGLYNSNANSLVLDFWGRRSAVYDGLKNNEIDRFHVSVRR